MKKFKILFLTGHRKSGTTLLLKLFDDHKDFLVYPSDLTILYAYYPKFNCNNYSFTFKKKRILEIVKSSLSSLKKNNNNFNKIDFLKSLSKKLTKKNINNIQAVLKLIVRNFANFSKKKEYKYIVIKETSMTMNLGIIKSAFKNIKFIQIIRDPRDNFASLKSGLKKYYNKIGEDKLILMASMIFRAKIDFDLIDFNKKHYGIRNFYLLKFENLVNKPRSEIFKICKFLKIKFEKKLLYPSTFGKKFRGNSYENSRLSNISNRNVNKWFSRLKNADIEVIEFFFKDIILKYKYPASNKLNIKSVAKFYTDINSKLFYKDSFFIKNKSI